MVVNDYACSLAERGAHESIASKLAPTLDRIPPGVRGQPVGASLLAKGLGSHPCGNCLTSVSQ
ncbi:hypothetical protein C1X61_13190 [Pseudomonas sp. FW215-T2]|nr:hypothetical protein C1X61_13190 [Pseudomonas sp. FW215-T2]PNB36723.1 hypothetical protein C1X63_16380 [Pseudomonas sp. FW305-131]